MIRLTECLMSRDIKCHSRQPLQLPQHLVEAAPISVRVPHWSKRLPRMIAHALSRAKKYCFLRVARWDLPRTLVGVAMIAA